MKEGLNQLGRMFTGQEGINGFITDGCVAR